MGRFFNEQIECMPRSELEKLQLECLKKTIRRVYDYVKPYRDKMITAGIKPEDIQTLADLQKLPFTNKSDLRDNYPFGMFAEPQEELVRIHASSGTTGKPTVVAYTASDLKLWAEMTARVIIMAGVTAHDTVQVAFGYGLFTGAFGMHYGLERVGALVVPMSVGNTQKQIMLMQDFGVTGLVCTPSYALYLAETAKTMGIEPKSIGLKYGLFGSEAWSEEMRTKIEEAWGLIATDNYGMSELIGPGVSGECLEQHGMHIMEDHFIVETINSDTGEVLQPGEIGELVFTSITKEALPMIRYRTHDISVIDTNKCKCGRTHARMSKIKGRTDDMLIIRGVNVFPSQIEGVLMEIEGVAPQYQLVITNSGLLDELEVRVELSPDYFSDTYGVLEKIEKNIKHRLSTVLGLSAKVKLVEPKSLERFEGKAKRILDLRVK